MQVIIEHDAHCPQSMAMTAECYGAVVRLVNDPRATQGTTESRRAVLSEILSTLQAQGCTCGANAEIARRKREELRVESSPTP